MKKIIINAFGKDKPGIVSKISGIINSFKGNIETSKMVQLETDFTILMLVQISKEKIKDLIKALEKIKDLNIALKTTDIKLYSDNYIKYSFSINATDNEGIIHLFSDLFQKYDINIISMDTYLKNAPVTGSPIFCLDSEIILNNRINLKDFKYELNKLADENSIDFNFEESQTT